MSKTILIGLREFRQRVRSRGFLIGSLGTPIFLIVMWVAMGAAGGGGSNAAQPPLADLAQSRPPSTVIGYVDEAGLIRSIPAPVPPGLFQAYPNTAAAAKALDQGKISAYYVVSADYRQTGDVERVSRRIPTAPADTQWFNWVLAGNLLPGDDPEQLARLRWPLGQSGPQYTTLNPRGETGAQGNTALPFVVTMAVLLPLFTGGSYLFRSLTQEKGSRVMEILLVSVRPRQLLTGKLLGFSVLILVQYLIWAAIGLVALTVTGTGLSSQLSQINFSGSEVLLIIPYALGGFILYAALMAGIGALAQDMESSRTWVFLITLPMIIPIYLWTAVANAPNGPLAVGLSLFPFSAPVAMLMRMVSTQVPAWQLGTSLVLLVVAGAGTIWLMARLFRAQTLLSGEPISLGRIWMALQTG